MPTAAFLSVFGCGLTDSFPKRGRQYGQTCEYLADTLVDCSCCDGLGAAWVLCSSYQYQHWRRWSRMYVPYGIHIHSFCLMRGMTTALMLMVNAMTMNCCWRSFLCIVGNIFISFVIHPLVAAFASFSLYI